MTDADLEKQRNDESTATGLAKGQPEGSVTIVETATPMAKGEVRSFRDITPKESDPDEDAFDALSRPLDTATSTNFGESASATRELSQMPKVEKLLDPTTVGSDEDHVSKLTTSGAKREPSEEVSQSVPTNELQGFEKITHRVKRIEFFNRQVPICLQNENGPCPLLAIANVLFLRGLISIHPDRSEVTSDMLVELIGNRLLESNAPLENPEMQENQQKTIADIMEILPGLQFGLDVNVRFDGVSSFEYNSRISVFDMLGINLYHGWVADPNDEITFSVLFNKSYNQLVDTMISADQTSGHFSVEGAKTGPVKDNSKAQEQIEHEALIGQQFLEDNANQLTFYGLSELHSRVEERELCVFFRNNHFCTMFRFQKELFILVTDLGYEHQPTIAWEKLNDVSGNTDFASPVFGDPSIYTSKITENSEENDRLLAMQLAEQENSYMTDPAYIAAQRRRMEELHQGAPPVETTRPVTTADGQKKKSNCILS